MSDSLEILMKLVARVDSLEKEVKALKSKKQTTEILEKKTLIPNGFNEALEHMHLVTGRKFRTSSELSTRLKDYSIEDIKLVIDYKAKEWMGTPSQKYLRPQTLFNKTKFEGYLNDAQQLVPTEMQHENRPNQSSKAAIDWDSTDWGGSIR
jgi:uncharacterized phage protein (TIGR02220 family)